jgi:hypothetical protein
MDSERGPCESPDAKAGAHSLTTESAKWATPHQHDATAGGRNQAQIDAHRERSGAGARNLHEEAPLWRTPDAPGEGGTRNRQASRGEGHQVTIAEQAEHWPTPNAMDANGHAQTAENPTPGQTGGATLPGASQNWMTPSGLDVKGGAYQYDNHDRTKPRPSLVGQSRSFHPAPAPSTSGDASSPLIPASRRRLNPRFVSWLMGWPLIGGTSSDSSVTASFRYKQRMASALSSLVSR